MANSRVSKKKKYPTLNLTLVSTVAKPNVGVRVDARDGDNIWAPGSVVGIDKNSVMIHYDGWESTYDESIPWNSNRLAPEFAFTKQVKYLPRSSSSHAHLERKKHFASTGRAKCSCECLIHWIKDWPNSIS